jgi:hypothetical protein
METIAHYANFVSHHQPLRVPDFLGGRASMGIGLICFGHVAGYGGFVTADGPVWRETFDW